MSRCTNRREMRKSVGDKGLEFKTMEVMETLIRFVVAVEVV